MAQHNGPVVKQNADSADGISVTAVDFTRLSGAVVDRPTVIREALTAVGVGAAVMQRFAEVTDLIVNKESAWNPNAVTGPRGERLMADGAPRSAQRGLTQLTPWEFAEHHVAGTSSRIYDPVANIAAAWRLVGAGNSVDLLTGHGLDELATKIRMHREKWFGDLST
ncbi:transglycosylase SLT domain-containing protein [Mycolicibacterium fortuitum]|uniref:Transglycosylase SLT domain-containing protein n=2 Tax=Mycolicibacterium fortuitum TaxID=1766 RepID=A0AAE5AEX0_MYCFO|nr:transglycosylase SLT domain-containing protein [Mycolicibacterium fortuitum]MCV7137938.1 transglycosylase SLT domain-containing protein [Mycolicibacterium fortuitum]MDV7194505.1 transglycosylase SLT domain-containing protein [Mycolicibacterium fortuitum]MDV7207866.1 transglycosylase SLT domain-containing protein [Mycolicibacterium fortuitum]MDV7229163.1 transglycosylase SLT domain-containing protein [Mycolicibacterium fortuitum]MDV7260863.1 transglycosylase SLT domain-containing protein [My